MSRLDLLNDAEEVLYDDAKVFEPYPNEKIRLKLHTGEKYEQLKASIIANGIMQPVIAMPSSRRGVLTVIAGWNRVAICSELNIPVKYQLKTNLTQDQADSICIDTNLLNRQTEDYLPSELSWILRTKWEISNHQGIKTSCNDCTKTDIENEFKIKKRSILMYIRLTYLTDELLNMVDENKINFVAGVTISFLKQKEMQMLYEYITKNAYKITPKIAEELKRLSVDNNYDIDVNNILNNLSGNIEKINIKLTNKTMKKIIDVIPIEDRNRIDEIILSAINQYYKS